MDNIARRRLVISAFGILIGLSSVNHGIFELIQRNAPVPGQFISAIGPEQQMWKHGQEMAFTLWPTYRVTGVFAVLFGIAFIVWSAVGAKRKSGPWIFLLIYAGSFLSGGGVAQTILVAVNAVLAFRLYKGTQGKIGQGFGRLWKAFLVSAIALGLFGMYLGIVGYIPGIRDPDAVIKICLSSIVASMLLFCLAFAAANARRNTSPDAA